MSVVVPVYNPGRHFMYCVNSVLSQSLPADEFEAIFVDDGSTDGTEKLLDELAAEHSNLTVIHIPNSGWPGRPRNVGTDVANGRYVHYLDNDDALGREALQRLYDFAEENAADVVFGRYAGHHRGVAREIFRETRPAVTQWDLLADTLTPHKMFRKEFLDREGLRFPEGRRRLEDHVFVSNAYLTANRISVLSDYVTYYHIRRDDGTNAAFQQFVPAGYFANVEEVIDVVEAHTEPGEQRDAFMRRTLRKEMLGRLNSRSFLSYDAEFQRELFDVVYKLDQRRIQPDTRDALPAPDRLRAHLLHQGDVRALMAYGEHIAGLRASAVLTSAMWINGALDIGFTTRLVTASGEPVEYDVSDGKFLLDLPADLDDGDRIPRSVRRIDDQELRANADLVVRFRSDSAEFFEAADVTSQVESGSGSRRTVSHHGRVRFDPTVWAAGAPLWPGIWDLYLRLTTGGHTREVRLGAARTQQAADSAVRAQLVAPAMLLRPYWTTPHDNLSVTIGSVHTAPDAVLAVNSAAVTIGDGGWPAVQLPFDVHPVAVSALSLRLASPASRYAIKLPVAVAGSQVTVADEPSSPHRPRAGEWRTDVTIGRRRLPTDTFLDIRPLGRRTIRTSGVSRPIGISLAVVARKVRWRIVRAARWAR